MGIMRKLERDQAEEYFELIEPGKAKVLHDLRKRMVRLAGAEKELIMSYQLPTIRVAGNNFLAFAAWNKFYSIYLLSGTLGKSLVKKLKQGELDKSVIRFSWDEKVTDETLQLIISAKEKELIARAKAR